MPYIPLSRPFVKRLIGTVRREYLEHTLFWTAADLENKLRLFQDYFNYQRVLSFAKTAYASKQLILASPSGKVISTC